MTSHVPFNVQYNTNPNNNPNNQNRKIQPSRPPMGQQQQYQQRPQQQVPQQTYFSGQMMGVPPNNLNQYQNQQMGMMGSNINFFGVAPFQVPNQNLLNNPMNNNARGSRPPMRNPNQQMYGMVNQQQNPMNPNPNMMPPNPNSMNNNPMNPNQMQAQQQQQQQQPKPHKAPMTGSSKATINMEPAMDNTNIPDDTVNVNVPNPMATNPNNNNNTMNTNEMTMNTNINTNNVNIESTQVNTMETKVNNNGINNKKPPMQSQKPNQKMTKNIQKPKSPKKKLKPWVQFTGENKQILPNFVGWAYRVREIWSVDRFILAKFKSSQINYDRSRNKFINFTLEGLRTPKVQKGKLQPIKYNNQNEPIEFEEAFGFEAREFVRKKIANKPVFYVGFSHQGQYERIYGDIYYKNNKDKWESLTLEVVKAGYAKLKNNQYSNSPYNSSTHKSKERKALEAAETSAKNNLRGVWRKGSAKDKRKIIQTNKKDNEDPDKYADRLKKFNNTLLNKYKGQILDGIVDQVITGSRLRIEMLPPKTGNNNNESPEHNFFIISLCGCSAGFIPMAIDEKEMDNRGGRGNSKNKSNSPQRRSNNSSISSDIVRKAKEFVEEKLLHQNVQIKMICGDKKGNIYSMVRHMQGDIAPLLLRNGLAKYEGWTANLCDNQYKKKLLDSKNYAKKNSVGLWKSIEHTNNDINEEEIFCTVTRIINGDTIQVSYTPKKSNDDIKEPKKITKRFTLASIRAPNIGQLLSKESQAYLKKSKKDKDKYDADRPELERLRYWGLEAKEVLRKRLIGKNVKLIHEYSREVTEPILIERYGKKQDFASVYVNEQNIANLLVKEGLANVLFHARGDTKSQDYGILQNSEEIAKKKQKGMHNRKAKLKAKIDYTKSDDMSNAQKRINLVRNLKDNKVDGVVEYVFNGNRVKVFLPKKNVFLPLMLVGIRSSDPRTLGQQASDQNNKNCQKYLDDLLLQRPVKVKIHECKSNTDQIRRMKKLNKAKLKKAQDPKNTSNVKLLRIPDAKYTFTGQIYYFDDNGEEINVAEDLLSKGLSKTFTLPKTTRGLTELEFENQFKIPPHWYAIEKKAKDNDIGLWKIANKFEREDKIHYQFNDNDIDLKANKVGEEMNIIVSHIDAATIFHINKTNSKQFNNVANKMISLKNTLNKAIEWNNDPKNKDNKKKIPRPRLKAGKLLAAFYDDEFARAKINRPDKRGEQKNDDNNNNNNNDSKQNEQPIKRRKRWWVSFIDYGNTASIADINFAELPKEVRGIPPLALKCQLGAVRTPNKIKENQWWRAAGEEFANLVLDRELKCTVLYYDKRYDQYIVDLTDENDVSIACQLARLGVIEEAPKNDYSLAKLQRLADKNEYIATYLKNINNALAQARNGHKGKYKYTSASKDDEYEETYP